MNPDGKVFIQTYRPSSDAVVMAARGQISGFYNREINTRKELKFPPYYRLIRFVFRGKNQDEVIKSVEKFNQILQKKLPDSGKAEILGPAECPLSLVAGNYRFHIILRAPFLKEIHKLALPMVKAFQTAPKVFLEVDIDPMSLL